MSLNSNTEVTFQKGCYDAELDEQWSFVQNKSNQRWLWVAIDHATGIVLVCVLGKRKNRVFKKLKAMLEPFEIKRFYTDDWGAYNRHIDKEKHQVGKANTQKIERKNLNFRTWIKRLARKIICCSKLERMHDIVIGLLINQVEFGFMINYKFEPLPATESTLLMVISHYYSMSSKLCKKLLPDLFGLSTHFKLPF